METETTTTVARRGDGRGAEGTRERPLVTPTVDIYENADEILLVADVPGVAREDVAIDLHKNQLTLTARRTAVAAGSTAGTDVAEYDYYRAFVVPQGLDAERMSAELANGVLRVHLPKSAALKPRRIEVKPG